MTHSAKEAEATLAYEPNCRLKSELGEDFQLSELVNTENITACQEIIDVALAEFFRDAEEHLVIIENLLLTPPDPSQLQALHTQVYHIRSHAKVLGLTLISEICMHVIAATSYRSFSQAQQHALLQKFVEALRHAFTHQIRDDGGKAGQQILRQLRQLR